MKIGRRDTTEGIELSNMEWFRLTVYVHIKGEREIARIEKCVDQSIQEPKGYIKKSKERLITALSNILGMMRTDKKKNQQKLGNRNGIKNEQLYGYFKQQTREIAHVKIWT